jgi:hypothetical protein
MPAGSEIDKNLTDVTGVSDSVINKYLLCLTEKLLNL